MNLPHFDQARSAAIDEVRKTFAAYNDAFAVIVDDLFGRISIKYWAGKNHPVRAQTKNLSTSLGLKCGHYWREEIEASKFDDPEKEEDALLMLAWTEGITLTGHSNIRLNDRVRHHSAWFLPNTQIGSIWEEDGPPVVVFHGFKGGAGRTTLLAAYALHRSRHGNRVAVIDMDLDAPGVGTLLSSDSGGAGALWGTADYLLEAAPGTTLSINDYHHTCPHISGDGQLLVFPTGQLNDDYLPKLARIDFDINANSNNHPLQDLLWNIRSSLAPDLILIDGRAGLASSAGLLLSGLAHMHVLVASASQQSMQGLERVIRHLGQHQIQQHRRQRECMILQTLIPDNSDVAAIAQATFNEKVEHFFRDGYYAKTPSPDDSDWSVADWDNRLAPHISVPISYRGKLAHFSEFMQVIDFMLSDPEYRFFLNRLDERLGIELPNPEEQ